MFPRILFVLTFAATLSLARAQEVLNSLTPCAIRFCQVQVNESSDLVYRTIGGTKHFVMKEIAPGADARTDKVRNYLAASPTFDLVRRFYSFAFARINGKDSQASLVVTVTDFFGPVGPTHAPYPVSVDLLDGSTVNVGSFLIFADINGPPRCATDGPVLSLDTFIKYDLLGLALAHEMAHQMMFDRYGPKEFPKLDSLSLEGHDTDQVTDPSMAFSEGWAEGFEAIIGDLLETRRQKPVITHPALRKMEQNRHELIARNRYVFEDLVKNTGRVRTGFQIVATEGVVANLVYVSAANKALRELGQTESYGVILDTLGRHKPRELISYWNAVMADAGSGQREALVRTFLEQTKYCTVHPEGPARYLEYWTKQFQFLRTPMADPARTERQKEFNEAKAQYDQWKSNLFKQTLANGRLDGALPPGLDPLWVDFGYDSRVGLNLATADQISDLLNGVCGDDPGQLQVAQKVTDHRDSSRGCGYFKDVASFAALLPPEKAAKIEPARQLFLAHVQANGRPNEIAAYLAKRSHCHTFIHRLAHACEEASHAGR